ncbi:hypothetical protein HMPREF9087_3415 [Enterococcus casseliflavus ATCC 12755]|uniref:Uncharacterized protein n=1 Tax=Enterococcus casseliflavus ATCC 12755 TaxID=888066 RepID=F0EPS3_ENTCA|nr:hypothetical protein HMPREF9087_3415 [Enterococcus casseliflavus ATCC 12755]
MILFIYISSFFNFYFNLSYRKYFYRYCFSENTKLKILFIYSLLKKNILLEFEADYFFKLFYKSSHQLNN